MNTPPPGQPACEGADPLLFEFDLFYDQAMQICETCPVRAWCLRQVDPARHTYYEGVAGGYPWQNGYPNLRYTQGKSETLDPILSSYLSTRKK